MRAYFESTAFECVIIDEAAKATLPELMLSVVHSKRVILVGDHYQLPPIFDEKRLVFDKTLDIQQLKVRWPPSQDKDFEFLSEPIYSSGWS